MGDLSPRLSRFEFECRCGCGFNTVDIGNLEDLEDVADHFQGVYTAERCYIIINSGCRCRNYNELVQMDTFKKRGQIYVPYSSKSRHMWGNAVDFQLIVRTFYAKFKIDPSEVYKYLDAKYPNSRGLGQYVTFTHLDQSKKRRRW